MLALVGGLFSLGAPSEPVIGGEAPAAVAQNAPILGADPSTYTPNAQPILGADPATYAPKELLGADPATYTPKAVQAEAMKKEKQTAMKAAIVAAPTRPNRSQ